MKNKNSNTPQRDTTAIAEIPQREIQREEKGEGKTSPSASLSNKIWVGKHLGFNIEFCAVVDIKKAVRELKDRWKKIDENLMCIEKTSAWDILDECRKQIDEIFGEKLI